MEGVMIVLKWVPEVGQEGGSPQPSQLQLEMGRVCNGYVLYMHQVKSLLMSTKVVRGMGVQR